LTVLTGCIPTKESRQIVRTEYVRQQLPEPPTRPEYYPVVFVKKDDRYCTSDEKSAKNLLKNRELDKGYQAEVKGMLEDLKGQDK
jgi:hypothetical protein